MTMRITVRQLRGIIREVLIEAGGGTTIPPRTMVNNPMSPSMPEREQIGRNSIKDMDDPDELAPHLLEPVEEPEDCWGPVPPVAPNPYAMPDFYTKDFNVIPTPQIKR